MFWNGFYRAAICSSLNSNFISNGLATNNEQGTISNINGTFAYNYKDSSEGGAIYNYSRYDNARIEAIDAEFIGNKANYYGAAIYNSYRDGESYVASIGSISGKFIDNSVNKSGGAIYNTGTYEKGLITSIEADFTNNTAKYGGGAISNSGVITSIAGNFSGNKATDYGNSASGGAIANGRIIGSYI